jgi:hypothetical protein
MEIIVHDHFTLTSDSDVFKQYSTPVWEIEVQSDILDTPEFESALRCDDNFSVSKGHNNPLRCGFNGTGMVADFLADSQKDFLLNLVSQSPVFQPRYVLPFDEYQKRAYWLATIYRDQAGFEMEPHLDNSHVMIQMVVNLLQDNNTSTEFYQFNESVPCYRAPLKQNHGVVFLNTPGALHRIANVDQTRWILYGGLVI